MQWYDEWAQRRAQNYNEKTLLFTQNHQPSSLRRSKWQMICTMLVTGWCVST